VNKLDAVADICNPSYLGGGNWTEASTGQKGRPYLKNNLKQKGPEIWLK
jgi:hypothetical protein